MPIESCDVSLFSSLNDWGKLDTIFTLFDPKEFVLKGLTGSMSSKVTVYKFWLETKLTISEFWVSFLRIFWLDYLLVWTAISYDFIIEPFCEVSNLRADVWNIDLILRLFDFNPVSMRYGLLLGSFGSIKYSLMSSWFHALGFFLFLFLLLDLLLPVAFLNLAFPYLFSTYLRYSSFEKAYTDFGLLRINCLLSYFESRLFNILSTWCFYLMIDSSGLV